MDNLSPSQKISKGLNTFFEGVKEALTDFMNNFVNAVGKITSDLLFLSSTEYIIKQANESEDKEIIKFLNIYYRTKNKRIRKKQITKIRNKLI